MTSITPITQISSITSDKKITNTIINLFNSAVAVGIAELVTLPICTIRINYINQQDHKLSVGQLIKTLSDTNKDLLDLGKKVKDLKSKKDDTQQPQHVTNALFVGSTAELQKLIGKR